jgi:hypothetical protein
MASLQTSAATNVLLMLPTEKSVSVASGVAGERIAAPETPVQVEPSGNTIAAETPGYLPPLRMPFRAAWRAVAFAGSRLAANELGAASREVGTGTIEMFGVAVGELDAGAEALGGSVGANDPPGESVGAELPQAAVAAANRIAAAMRAGRSALGERLA